MGFLSAAASMTIYQLFPPGYQFGVHKDRNRGVLNQATQSWDLLVLSTVQETPHSDKSARQRNVMWRSGAGTASF